MCGTNHGITVVMIFYKNNELCIHSLTTSILLVDPTDLRLRQPILFFKKTKAVYSTLELASFLLSHDSEFVFCILVSQEGAYNDDDDPSFSRNRQTHRG